MMKKTTLTLAMLSAMSLLAQNTDTLKIMFYNLLNFPAESPTRIADLKVIVQEAKPDIFMVCELTSGSGATGILNNALNQDGITYYAQATYVPGPNTDNMLFYNSNKIGLKEQNVITTALRDINEYVVYYKSADLSTTVDTTFFYVYVCHLKASQGYEAERAAEAQNLKDYLDGRPEIENILIGGDFNMYTSSEPAWDVILNGGSVPIKDPINTPGNWNNNSSFADIHTQSTRTTSFDFGASGGMDDRFDIIFISNDLQNWGSQARIIDGTYWAYGQDGLHFNSNITDAPTNATLPTPVIQALYNMSDHLPVYLEIEVQESFNGIVDDEIGITVFYHAVSDQLHINYTNQAIDLGAITIYNQSGKEVLHLNQITENALIDISNLQAGLYILRSEMTGYTLKFVK